jgi:hypothetical protein
MPRERSLSNPIRVPTSSSGRHRLRLASILVYEGFAELDDLLRRYGPARTPILGSGIDLQAAWWSEATTTAGRRSGCSDSTNCLRRSRAGGARAERRIARTRRSRHNVTAVDVIASLLEAGRPNATERGLDVEWVQRECDKGRPPLLAVPPRRASPRARRARCAPSARRRPGAGRA